MFYTYILYSDSTKKFYIGQCEDFDKRLVKHNSGLNKSTKSGLPWKEMIKFTSETRAEAMKLEKKIKNFKSQKRIFEFITQFTNVAQSAPVCDTRVVGPEK
jgi:putative endonuclease